MTLRDTPARLAALLLTADTRELADRARARIERALAPGLAAALDNAERIAEDRARQLRSAIDRGDELDEAIARRTPGARKMCLGPDACQRNEEIARLTRAEAGLVALSAAVREWWDASDFALTGEESARMLRLAGINVEGT